MNRILTLVLVFFAFTATFDDELGVSLNFFRAGFEGTDVKIEWDLASENSVTGFEVSRKLPNESTFRRINGLSNNGSKYYKFIDTDLRNTPNRVGTITYKLHVSSSTGDAAFTTTFANNPSSVERSWGSIKSMFR